VTHTAPSTEVRSIVPAGLVAASLALLAVGVLTGVSIRATAGFVILMTFLALVRPVYLGWPRLIAGLTLLILFVPIRRYALPGNLPFQLEPYRVFVALLVSGWIVSLLVDPRTRIRRTGFEAPLLVIAAASLASIVANPARVEQLSPEVNKKLMFFLSFVLVLYVISSVIRRLDNVDYLAKTLVAGGATVGLFAILEARTGINVFNHLDRVVPILGPGGVAEPEAFQKFGAAKLRVFGSAEHPIALSAAFVVLTPLALYLARRYRQRRWMLCTVLLVAGCSATVSRTGIMMLVVVLVVFLWLRPRETLRLWPLVIPALIVIKLVIPGTLGAIKQSFIPPGGLVAEQSSMAGEIGSGRIADLGPGLTEWKRQPLLGQGFGTRVVDPTTRGPRANILDNQWLGTLLETGVIGFFGWLWFFARVVRRFGAEAKNDDSARGWLLASIAAGVAAYAAGMLTYDAFSFIQVTYLLFIFVGLGSALLAERPTPLAARAGRRERAARIPRGYVTRTPNPLG
jgi:polysaccharide biosynthesis protein PslJ